MIGAAADHADLIAWLGGEAGILFQQLCVAGDRVQRRAQFMAQADDVPAFGQVGGFRDFLRALQFGVSAFVGVDLLNQKRGLRRVSASAARRLCCASTNSQGDHADDDRECKEDFPEHIPQQLVVDVGAHRGLKIDQAQRQPDQPGRDGKDPEIVPDLRVDAGIDMLWQQLAEALGDLRLDAGVRLAEIMTTRIERTA